MEQLKRESLANRVDAIIRLVKDECDNEEAHALEDALRLELIREHCPGWVVEEVNRLAEAEFTRWYA